jgi:hypothetical protein
VGEGGAAAGEGGVALGALNYQQVNFPDPVATFEKMGPAFRYAPPAELVHPAGSAKGIGWWVLPHDILSLRIKDNAVACCILFLHSRPMEEHVEHKRDAGDVQLRGLHDVHFFALDPEKFKYEEIRRFEIALGAMNLHFTSGESLLNHRVIRRMVRANREICEQLCLDITSILPNLERQVRTLANVPQDVPRLKAFVSLFVCMPDTIAQMWHSDIRGADGQQYFTVSLELTQHVGQGTTEFAVNQFGVDSTDIKNHGIVISEIDTSPYKFWNGYAVHCGEANTLPKTEGENGCRFAVFVVFTLERKDVNNRKNPAWPY